MPRGVEYDADLTQTDNPVLPEQTKVHGINPENAEMSRVHRTAELPEGIFGKRGLHSGAGSRGSPYSGSGKGGRNPRGLGEMKGLGAHKADGPDSWGQTMRRM